MTEKSPPFALTEEERRNPLWLKLLEHFDLKRDELRRRNDNDHDERGTAALRGRIGTYSYLIGLNRPRPPRED